MSNPRIKLDYDILSKYFKYEHEEGRFFRKIQMGNYKPDSEVTVAEHHSGYKYISIKIDCKRHNLSLHRIAWTLYYKKIPENFIDHINHIRSDNRIENLREVSKVENNKNQSMPKHNTSGFVGVSYHKRDKIWEARIKVNYNQIYLGRFKTKEEAIEARKKAEVQYGFHANHGR